MSNYSYVELSGNGAIKNFQFDFPYMNTSHISAEVDGVDTEFTWLAANIIQIDPAPAADSDVVIRRTTPVVDPTVVFENGAGLDQADLNASTTQMLYIVQESLDAVTADPTITDEDLITSDVTDNNVSTTKHGFAPKLPNDPALFLNGQGEYTVPAGTGGGGGGGSVTDSAIVMSDVTTNNATILKHGFLKKLDNIPTNFMNGQGEWTAPPVTTDDTLITTDSTGNNVSTSKHGFVPKAPNDANKFLNGLGAWATPAGGGTGDVILIDSDITQTTFNNSTAATQLVSLSIPAGELTSGKRARMVTQLGIKHTNSAGMFIQLQGLFVAAVSLMGQEWSLPAVGYSHLTVEQLLTSIGTDQQIYSIHVSLSAFSGNWNSFPKINGSWAPTNFVQTYDDAAGIAMQLAGMFYTAHADLACTHLSSKLYLES